MDAEAAVRKYESGERDFGHANLTGADLTHANLTDAKPGTADLSRANLCWAKVTSEHLADARSLEGTTMPDGTESTWPD